MTKGEIDYPQEERGEIEKLNLPEMLPILWKETEYSERVWASRLQDKLNELIEAVNKINKKEEK